METFVIAKKNVYLPIGLLIFLGLYLTSLYNYLLFHSFAEIFSIVVACGIFVIAWNSRRFLNNNYLLFIGIAYLFVATLDLIHTLSYTGMGVFKGYETNLPTQLWIAARYMESISFLIAPLLFRRKLKVNLIFLGYVLVTSILLLSIFYWDIFPVCFIEGMGLTPFKKISEYIISLILSGSIVLLLRNQREFDRGVLQWVIGSIILTIVSELAFTFYIDAYGLSNLMGHFFKIISFYLIYKAIIETGLRRPYDLLSRDLRQREEALARLASFPELNPNPIAEIDLTGNVYYLNPAAKELFPNLQTAGPKHLWLADFESLVSKFKQEPKASYTREVKIGSRWYQQSIHYAAGDRIRIYGLDITNQKRMEEELRRSREELEIRVQERTAALAKANKELTEQSRILESFFKSTITPLVFLDRNFNFIRVNEAYAKACKRDVSDFPGHNHFEFYPSDAQEIFEQVVETKMSHQAIGRSFSFPDHPEWGVTYWDWILTPILDDSGEVEFLVFSLEDVTERKRAQEAVAAERQRFNEVLEILPAYLVLLTPDYHVPFANRFFRERFGESHGRRCFEYLFGRSEPCEICETFTVLKTMTPHEWEWTGPDGRTYQVFDFPFTNTDSSLLILEMGIDVTERKRAQEALNAASLYTRSLIEASLDPLVTISTDGKIMDVNKATELVTGVSREHLIGTDFSDYFTDPREARKGYKEVFLKGFVTDYPLSIRHISGKVTDVLYHATVYKNKAGVIQGVFAAARDITVRKGLQRRIEATNSLLNLFVRMSSRKEYLDGALGLIQRWSGCRCVGIRVLDEKDYIPYESYAGFDREFWESENFLSVKYNQCACIRVVTGNLDPQDLPVSTPAGSFRCENTFEFIGSLSEEEKARFRGVCIKSGFKSVAVIPVRYRDKVLGAIHLADEKEGKVPIDNVEFIESMAPLIGEALNRFNLEEELRESENRLRLLSSQLLTVQENERKQIARDLHDGIGQTLSAIKFGLESKLNQMNKAPAPPGVSLESIISLAQNGIEESRRIQMDLRPSILDDLGILATIGWFTREFQKVYSQISIEKETNIEEKDVSNSLKTVIFRIIQEATNNISKHSRATLIQLSLGKKEDKIELMIEDNGMGFDLETSKRGLGITSMRERTELSGGSFSIESILGKGTTIRASWPI